MPNTKRLVVVVAVPWLISLSGCVSSSVHKGTLIGAASGALLGAGTGALISNEHLLGSSKASQLQLEPGPSIGGGALIGAVFGALVGAMVGHQNDDPLKVATEPAPATQQDSAAQGRAPKLF